MAIPSVVQGLIELEDGKVFELDSPKGAAWVEAISSFRFEPTSDSKACTIRREPSGYWYGCRKIAGKVRKKYIGKSSEISIAKLEEIAKALEAPPVPRVTQVVEVAQKVAQDTQVVEVAQKVAQDTQVAEKVAQEVAENRLAALELEVANLRKALEALKEALLGKSGLGDSGELPNVDNTVVEELQNELSNLKAEDRYLHQKLAESRDTVEALNWGTEALNEQLATANQTIAGRNEKIESLKQELAENTRYYTVRLNEAGATVSTFKDKLEAAQAKNQRLQNELGNLQAEREELAQLKKEAKEAAAEVHREARSIELEKVRWQRELSDAKAELADAKVTILNQGNKIRELERGYSLQPNPEEKRLRLEIGELQEQLSDLRQKSATANKDLEAADLLNQLRAERGKSTASLADVKLLVRIIKKSCDDTSKEL